MSQGEKKDSFRKLKSFYDKEYKKLFIIPILLLVLALAQIGYQYSTTGDFLNKGIALKGGVTITIPDKVVDIVQLNDELNSEFSDIEVSVRSLNVAGTQEGVIIDADINSEDNEMLTLFTETIENKLSITKDEYSIDITGSALGESFFHETLRALVVAFLFMGAVVFLYFGNNFKTKAIVFILTAITSYLIFNSLGTITDIISAILSIVIIGIFIRYSIPSVAVVVAALSDIIITLAIVNIMGIKLSTAGIAAFLMLIGYSVDTDILLSTRVLKRKEGSVFSRVLGAMKTGLTMNITTMVALVAAFLISSSEVIKQIMLILLIGLIVDIINTWIQNVGILRLYIEKSKKNE